MKNDQLLNYINQARQSGTADNKIKETLLQSGWIESYIDEALKPELRQMSENATSKPKRKIQLWLKIILIIFGMFIVLSGVFAAKYYVQQKAIANLEKTGSVEYKKYIESIDKISEQLVTLEAEMKAKGSSTEDIEVAKRDFINFIGSTLLLKIQFESTSLTNLEKKAVLQRLQKLGIENKSTLAEDFGCDYTEQELPLQDFFVGATLKFKKPMVYIDWKEEKTKYCSPSFSATRYYSLESVSQWDSTIFDKKSRGIREYKVDPSITFTVEGRIKLHSRRLFGERDLDHYILRDSNGEVIVVPFFNIFDQYYEDDTIDDGEAGAELYKNGQYIGYVVSDISSGGVWIHGALIPQDVIDANTPKRPTTFETPIAKRDEFIRRIMFALEEGKIDNYTSKELIDNDLGRDIYTYRNGEIIHNYGGQVYMKKDGNTLSLIFEKIPKGQECYYFYWMNDPEIWGFKETYIDGVLETYNLAGSKNWNPIFEEFKQRVCFNDKDSMTIEFRGDVNEIKQKAVYRKRSEMPKYIPNP
jgi:hypothetical protein